MHRWTSHDQLNENGEEPLLLHPCVDPPHTFIDVDDLAVVREKQPAPTRGNDRARESIIVFGLNRSELVEERLEHRKRILALFSELELNLRQLPHLPAGPVKDETRTAAQTKLGTLRAERAPASPYLLMKTRLIDEFLARVGPELERLGFA